MAFDEKFIDELKQKNNIVDVVSKYCVLKRRGSVNHWACCPLPGHSEKTPSFTVNEAGQFFKCFGCGKGGDVITFVMIILYHKTRGKPRQGSICRARRARGQSKDRP